MEAHKVARLLRARRPGLSASDILSDAVRSLAYDPETGRIQCVLMDERKVSA